MASTAAPAPSMAPPPLQIGEAGPLSRLRDWIEYQLEAERGQLPLWLPVMFGTGIAAWLILPDPASWTAGAVLLAGLALTGLALRNGGRAPLALGLAALAMLAGMAIIAWRAEQVAAPVLTRPIVIELTGTVERVEQLPARGLVRVRLGLAAADLPPTVRINLDQADVPVGLARGAVLRLRARLVPPAPPGVPGAYDFARVAWFDGIGATGRSIGKVAVLKAAPDPARGLRDRLSAHIQSQLPGSAGGIAAALATGDEGGISEADAEAMRRSGLSHLLSVSGLHVTAVVAATMLFTIKLLALSPWAARRWRLPLVAAAVAGVAAIGYTWLTGAEVPTVRACIAALLVLAALAIGREAITLRLVAAGALIVLAIFPEAIAGPSFQLSFAAVTAIVAFHAHPRVRAWFERREEGWGHWLARGVASTLLTGIAIELALTPIALFHFHKSGVYGAFANIVAIPLTTFVIMPLEAVALVLDAAGLGVPLWWLTGLALSLLLWIAHATASAPGAVAMLPSMPAGAFAMMILGGLWIALWRTGWRRWGLLPVLLGAGWALVTPPPDLIVTGDGRHVAVRSASGDLALLRARSGDYVRTMLGEAGGVDAPATDLDTLPGATCNRDLCWFVHRQGGRIWQIAATRSDVLVPIDRIVALCGQVDLMISNRRLPRTCHPRWAKLDRTLLAQTGGIAIHFASGRVETVRRPGDRHPWIVQTEGLPRQGLGSIRQAGGPLQSPFR